MFIIIAFIGTFIEPKLYFLHLIDIFCNIKTLAFIFQAIAQNVIPLVAVSVMAVVFVYVFSTVAFSTYLKDIYSEEDS